MFRRALVKFERLELEEVILVKPTKHGDDRGFFVERFRQNVFAENGIDVTFVQENFSRSQHKVLRGLHYQFDQPQGKLVTVTRGSIIDVAVDIRRNSPNFGKHVSVELKENELIQNDLEISSKLQQIISSFDAEVIRNNFIENILQPFLALYLDDADGQVYIQRNGDMFIFCRHVSYRMLNDIGFHITDAFSAKYSVSLVVSFNRLVSD